MKKILFAFALMLALTIGVTAQTTVQVNDTNAGYVEQYPAISLTLTDTTFTYDTVGDVVDTIINITYDTQYIEGYYDYRAFAYPGYHFDRWEVITTYNTWYDFDHPDSAGMPTLIDSVYSDTIIQYNVEYDEDSVLTDFEGWLDWDMGIPDLSEVPDIEDITSITVTAYFIADEPVGIERVEVHSFIAYPNPTTGIINIRGCIRNVTVYDQSGRIVISTIQPVIDLQGQPRGVYFGRVTTADGKTAVIKIIKR